MYTHLSISGGGIKGAALLGALHILNEKKMLNNIEGYSGSSIGGLIVFLLNIGYNSDELYEIFMNINFEKYRDIKFTSLFDNWGLDSGEKIMKLIKIIIKQKNISPSITFIELYNKSKKHLVLTGSELYKNEVEYYDYVNTPNMKILDAIRITISFPIFFHPIHQNNENEKKILIDGGLFSPYAIEYFNNIEKKNKIGIFLHNFHQINEIKNAEDFLSCILSCLQERFEKFYLNDYLDCSIIINFKEINPMDFSISNEIKQKMYNIGKTSALNYLNKLSK
jgi:predicted acylesterase/phospholipase RssA